MSFMLCTRSQTLLTLSNTLNILFRGISLKRKNDDNILQFYKSTLNISETEVEFLFKHCPRLKKIEYKRVPEAIEVLSSYNFARETLFRYPSLLSIAPPMIQAHCDVILECGMKLKPKYIVHHYKYISNISIGKLLQDGDLPNYECIIKRLFSIFSDFPADAVEQFKNQDFHSKNLCGIRSMVMQKYISWRLELDEETVRKFYNTYFQFKHRPLKDVELSISLALNDIQFSKKKIQTYSYVLSVNPHNTKKILNEVREIGGTAIRDILRTYPGIIRTDYKSILQIKNILVENGFPEEFHHSALHIYTLKPETIESRLKELKKNEIFNSLSASERLLLIVVYKNKFMKRVSILKKVNKQCPRVQTFIAANEIFERYTKSFGDKSYGKEVVLKINEILSISQGSDSKQNFDKMKTYLERHCFYLCVPLISIIGIINLLLKDFTKEEIRQNIHIVFYSWDLIHKHLENFKIAKQMSSSDKSNNNEFLPFQNIHMKLVDYENLTDNQILSLTLYLIEKDHFFTGDGIWNENLCKDTILEQL